MPIALAEIAKPGATRGAVTRRSSASTERTKSTLIIVSATRAAVVTKMRLNLDTAGTPGHVAHPSERPQQLRRESQVEQRSRTGVEPQASLSGRAVVEAVRHGDEVERHGVHDRKDALVPRHPTEVPEKNERTEEPREGSYADRGQRDRAGTPDVAHEQQPFPEPRLLPAQLLTEECRVLVRNLRPRLGPSVIARSPPCPKDLICE